MSAPYATIGGIGTPFGSIVVASNATTNYSLAKQSGYSVSAVYKTIAFPVSSANTISQIDLIMVETERLSTGAKLDTTITYNQAKSTLALTQIAYSSADTTR